jgi:acyl-homoserine-lactone acylase
MIPGLLKSYDNIPASDPRKVGLADPIAALRGWDYRWSTNSIPTSLAVFWGEDLFTQIGGKARQAAMSAETYAIERATDAERLQSLTNAKARLDRDFGNWRTPWGEINRFQRITDEIAPKFDDSAASIPVPFTSSTWGSLASFRARAYPGTRKWYGTSGNSFVAAIEFGDSVHARAITAGGESGTPSSPHFNDEALRYSTGNLRDVYFYPSQLKGHIERVYHPGENTNR